MLCPNCGNENKTVKHVRSYHSKRTGGSLNVHFFECSKCNHLYAGIRKWLKTIPCPADLDLPIKMSTRVQQLSPTAFKIYCETLMARSMNLTSFVGIGLRKALEALLHDYLINFKSLPEKKMTLKEMSDKMISFDSNFYAEICNNVVRVYGNDSVHITTNFPQLNLSDALDCFEILCGIIDTKLNEVRYQ